MTDKSNYRAADDRYEAQNDPKTEVSGDINDDSYVRSGDKTIPVQKDSAPVEDPIQPPQSNSDAQLGKTDNYLVLKLRMRSNYLRYRAR